MLGNRAYDRDSLRADLLSRAVTPVMPPRTNRRRPVHYDHDLNQLRNRIEPLVGRLKEPPGWRRATTKHPVASLEC
jgi:hypothetical protein